jgi:hypothetical protein
VLTVLPPGVFITITPCLHSAKDYTNLVN